MTVPLSEREKQILDEIEQNLYSEDPSFARDIREPWWKKFRQVKFGAGLIVVGALCLIAGFVANDLLLPLGLIAFVLMLLGVVLLSSATHDIAKEQIEVRHSTATDRGPGSVPEKLNEWQEKLRDRYKKRP